MVDSFFKFYGGLEWEAIHEIKIEAMKSQIAYPFDNLSRQFLRLEPVHGFLNLFVNEVTQFSTQDILAGKPRQLAEGLNSPYAGAIARALRRHVYYRTQSALELWKDIRAAVPPSVQV